MLLRVGGGANSRLSIARDTIVDIPGPRPAEDQRRLRDRRRPAGHPARSASTSASTINHVIEVSSPTSPTSSTRWAASTTRAAASSRRSTAATATAASRSGSAPARRSTSTASRRSRWRACARTTATRTRTTSPARAASSAILAAMRSRGALARGLRPPAVDRLAGAAHVPTDMSGPTLAAVFAGIAVGGTPDTSVLGTVDGNVPDGQRDGGRRALPRRLAAASSRGRSVQLPDCLDRTGRGASERATRGRARPFASGLAARSEDDDESDFVDDEELDESLRTSRRRRRASRRSLSPPSRGCACACRSRCCGSPSP